MKPVQLTLMAATPTAVHPERCLWQRHREAACKYCFEACQAGALQMAGRTVILDTERCSGCGVCLAACPVECFESASWSERSLISTSVKIGMKAIEVACKCHPAPGVGNEAAPVIQVNACLGAISPGLWYELGLNYTVRARMEHCTTCPLTRASFYARRAIDLASSWLEAGGLMDRMVIQEVIDDPEEARRRKVISAERPVLNRRDFLFGFARSAGPAVQALLCLPVEPEGVDGIENLPPHLPGWLRQLSKVYTSDADAALEASPQEAVPDGCECVLWPTLTVADNCAACGACARYCPSGALSTAVANGNYQHLFSPGVCISCGLCAQVCRTGALSRSYVPNSDPFDVQVVAERAVTACRKCGSPALKEYQGLCYWCAAEAPMRSLLDNARDHLLKR